MKRKWLYCVRRAGWVLVQLSTGDVIGKELAGPFDDSEVRLAVDIWGVPFVDQV